MTLPLPDRSCACAGSRSTGSGVLLPTLHAVSAHCVQVYVLLVQRQEQQLLTHLNVEHELLMIEQCSMNAGGRHTEWCSHVVIHTA